MHNKRFPLRLVYVLELTYLFIYADMWHKEYIIFNK